MRHHETMAASAVRVFSRFGADMPYLCLSRRWWRTCLLTRGIRQLIVESVTVELHLSQGCAATGQQRIIRLHALNCIAICLVLPQSEDGIPVLASPVRHAHGLDTVALK